MKQLEIARPVFVDYLHKKVIITSEEHVYRGTVDYVGENFMFLIPLNPSAGAMQVNVPLKEIKTIREL